MWNKSIHNFEIFLKLEKSLSPNSVSAYIHDIHMLTQYLDSAHIKKEPAKIELSDLQKICSMDKRTGG